MSVRTPATLLSGLAFAALAFPAGAAAHGSDRDHDKMPDRWEKRNGLNTKRNDARRDRDRDGLRNLAEFKAGTSPRDRDSDDDGLKDGDEQAGTIVSFTPDSTGTGGVLVIKTFDGETLTGTVTPDTELSCEDADAPAAAAKPNSKDDDDLSPPLGADEDDEDGIEDEDEDEGEDEEDCGVESLEPGVTVDEARLAVTAAGRVWREVELG